MGMRRAVRYMGISAGGGVTQGERASAGRGKRRVFLAITSDPIRVGMADKRMGPLLGRQTHRRAVITHGLQQKRESRQGVVMAFEECIHQSCANATGCRCEFRTSGSVSLTNCKPIQVGWAALAASNASRLSSTVLSGRLCDQPIVYACRESAKVWM